MITLSSDFGSPYPAAMKAVIACMSDTRMVDVSHDFPRQDVRTTAFWLREILPYFPPAVHLVVVDPGVGTDRDALVVRAGEHALVGPDNGVLLPPARELAGGGTIEVFAVEQATDSETTLDPRAVAETWPPGAASSTFHGRDVFAPTATRVHELGVRNIEDEDAFTRKRGYEDFTLPQAEVGESVATGEILVIDDFGNAITNIPGEFVAQAFGSTVDVNGEPTSVERSYAHRSVGDRLLTVGSHGNVELAVNQGRGDEAFAVDVESAVTIRLDFE